MEGTETYAQQESESPAMWLLCGFEQVGQLL